MVDQSNDAFLARGACKLFVSARNQSTSEPHAIATALRLSASSAPWAHPRTASLDRLTAGRYRSPNRSLPGPH